MGNSVLYQVDALPVQQNRMFESAEEAKTCSKGAMSLVQNEETGLIFNNAFDPTLVAYGKGYQNEQACSGTFQNHLEQVAEIVQRFFSGKRIAEIGCGKGWFLELLRSKGFDIIGIDPAYEGDSLHVVKEPFSANLNVRADAFVLRHVLEHINGPLAFLNSIAEANDHRGLIYIEVPCMDWIISRRAWFDIYYEHVNYFRLSDLTGIFGTILKKGRLFGGQYLYVVADLATLKFPRRHENDWVQLPDDFCGGVYRAISLIRAKGKKQIAIWGGASKGVIFSLFLSQRGLRPDFIIDINPAKQGKFLAATGFQVYSPGEALPFMSEGDHIFILNSNYLNEIRENAGPYFRFHMVDNYGL